ncbi:phosphoglycerate kinase [bacterium]|nr:phosphoglycerate kinase [bacterium]
MAFNKMTLDDIDVRGKRVLMRVDFNVPFTEDKKVADDTRIRAALPSIRKVLDGGGRLVLMSHLGRPKGEPKQEFSLLPVAHHLSELLGQRVGLAPDTIGPEVMLYVEQLKEGSAILLENVRFHKGETANDKEFSAALSRLGDVYVNDAFGTAHRAHASTTGVTEFLQPAVAGYLMAEELKYLGEALENPKRPFWAVLGGAKISGKLDVIENLLPKLDGLILGGAMTFTLDKADGKAVGNSLVEEDRIEMAKALLKRFSSTKIDVRLPMDYIVADKFEETANTKIVDAGKIEEGWSGLDIGPASCKFFTEALQNAGTVVWNGPMGVFEMAPFSEGTRAVATALAEATSKGAITVVGGGDSASALHQMDMDDQVSHVSTGGGAALEFLEGKVLPGVAALTNRN